MQKNNAFCSICTINYSSYAGVLNDSLKKVGHAEPHYVLVVDYTETYKDVFADFNFIPVDLKELFIPNVEKIIENYSPFELSNALKPFFMEWLLKKHKDIDTLVYLDTDIYVYERLDAILAYIEENNQFSVVLTPHIHDYAAYKKITNYSIEELFLTFGLYNGGFYVLKNDEKALTFLDWHKSKLFEFGYNRPAEHMFVDQKILDLAPVLFDFVGLYKDKTYNAAHWNHYERPIEICEENSYCIEGEKLVFYHFSQIKVNESNLRHSMLGNLSIENEPVLQEMLLAYLEKLNENGFEKNHHIPYQFKDKYKKQESKLDVFEAIKIERDRVQAELSSIKQEMEGYKRELEKIHASREWRIAGLIGVIVRTIFPKGSLQRKLFIKFWLKVKPFVKYIFRKKEQALEFIYLAKYFIIMKYKLNKKVRKINSDSNKILFIGHSYHAKTKSSSFIIDELKKEFDVEVLYDDSWKGGSHLDFSFANDSYYAIVFWQILPPRNILNQIQNENIIFFPMYDGVSKKYSYWRQYYDLKIISFSETLYKKLKKWGFDVVYVQYFPEVNEFVPGNKNQAFFWQRIEKININTMGKIFANSSVSLHMHRAVDPGQELILPTPEQEKLFEITYSDWFETREDMLKEIKQRGIYIAPREMEGIGMSFLEALAMGKAVIAANMPTMNEYIENGKTGFLFDSKNPHPIDFTKITEIQRNAYEFMKKGFDEWKKQKYKIIEKIKQQ